MSRQPGPASRKPIRSKSSLTPPSPRADSLTRLQAGELDVLFAVDMFNEGVDLPNVDTVLMLRPTESLILWLQQLGRGLRWRRGKRLKVVDYIGNHRSFLGKARQRILFVPYAGVRMTGAAYTASVRSVFEQLVRSSVAEVKRRHG